jgi:hypothetical protein
MPANQSEFMGSQTWFELRDFVQLPDQSPPDST